MQELIALVLQILDENSGEMSYRELYDDPRVINQRGLLNQVKTVLKEAGDISIVVRPYGDDNRYQSVWTKVN